MIWPKIPGLRHGEAYVKQSMVKGQFVYIAGTVSSADMPLGTPGKSSAGDPLVMLARAASLQTGPIPIILTSGLKFPPIGVYPVNKLIYKPENDELDEQVINSGENVMYYRGGEYETDQWEDATATMATSKYGDPLYLNGNARLTRDAGWAISGYLIAYLIQRLNAPDSGSGVIGPTFGDFVPTTSADGRSGGLIWYRLINTVG